MATEPLTADEIIAHLGLKPHPEGGYFKETFRDEPGHKGRAHSTAILYLLRTGEVSRWHRVDAAEMWHWYGGAPLKLVIKAGRGQPRAPARAEFAARRASAGAGAGESLADRGEPRGLDARRLHRGAGLRLRRLRARPRRLQP